MLLRLALSKPLLSSISPPLAVDGLGMSFLDELRCRAIRKERYASMGYGTWVSDGQYERDVKHGSVQGTEGRV